MREGKRHENPLTETVCFRSFKGPAKNNFWLNWTIILFFLHCVIKHSQLNSKSNFISRNMLLKVGVVINLKKKKNKRAVYEISK